jgi:hypothetical protein
LDIPGSTPAGEKVRIYIYDLACRLGVTVKGSGLAEGIEVFPKHDAIAAGAFGNALRGPLGVHRGAKRRFWFTEDSSVCPRYLAFRHYVLIPSIGNGSATETGSQRTFETHARAGKAFASGG